MGKNVNAVVQVDVQNLHRPLVTFQARQLSSFVAELRGVPDDIVNVGVTVYKPDGQHFITTRCSQDANGYWKLYITPTMLPDAGEAKYEVIGTDDQEMTAPLGEGRLLIDPFGSGSLPIPEGKAIQVFDIPDKNGIAHKIVAVNVGTEEHPDWTTRLED